MERVLNIGLVNAAMALALALLAAIIARFCHRRPALVASRVIDETGYVQPTIAQLRAQRGSNSIYHNNSIQTWQVKPDGSVFNVQLA